MLVFGENKSWKRTKHYIKFVKKNQNTKDYLCPVIDTLRESDYNLPIYKISELEKEKVYLFEY